MKLHRWTVLALGLTSTTAFAAPAANGPIPAVPFINDDYPRALAEARAKKIPIFIEAWAPW